MEILRKVFSFFFGQKAVEKKENPVEEIGIKEKEEADRLFLENHRRGNSCVEVEEPIRLLKEKVLQLEKAAMGKRVPGEILVRETIKVSAMVYLGSYIYPGKPGVSGKTGSERQVYEKSHRLLRCKSQEAASYFLGQNGKEEGNYDYKTILIYEIV